MDYDVNGVSRLRSAVVAGVLLVALLAAVLVSIRTREPATVYWAGNSALAEAAPAL
jgi:hypothetical protein